MHQPLSGLVLETERTWMRELMATDADALHRVIGDAAAMGPQARTMGETCGWIRHHQDLYARHGFSLWALIAKDGKELIGDCGVFNRSSTGSDQFELRYHLRRDHWGRGLATEAAIAVRDYGRERLHAPRLVAITQPTNTRSKRIMEKVGMTLERTFDKPNPHGAVETRVLYSMRL